MTEVVKTSEKERERKKKKSVDSEKIFSGGSDPVSREDKLPAASTAINPCDHQPFRAHHPRRAEEEERKSDKMR